MEASHPASAGQPSDQRSPAQRGRVRIAKREHTENMLETFHAARKKRSEAREASATDLERAGAFPDATRAGQLVAAAALTGSVHAVGIATAGFPFCLTAVSLIG